MVQKTGSLSGSQASIPGNPHPQGDVVRKGRREGENIMQKKGGREVQTFKDLIVWQKSHQLFLDLAHDYPSLRKGRKS